MSTIKLIKTKFLSRKWVYVSICVLLSLTSVSLASERKRTMISGKFELPVEGKISLRIHKYFFPARSFLDSKADTVNIVNNEFKFVTDNIDSCGYVSIFYHGTDGIKIDLSTLRMVLIKAGSQIFMKIAPQSISFSGNGSEILRAQFEANKVPKSFFEQNPIAADSVQKNLVTSDLIQFMLNKLDQYYKLKKEIIESYKDKFDAGLLDKILAFYEGEKLSRTYTVGGHFNNAFNYYDERKRDAILRFYVQQVHGHNPVADQSSSLADVPFYAFAELGYLKDKIKFDNKNFVYRSQELVPVLFDTICKNYSGLFRERMLMEFIADMSLGSHPDFSKYCVTVDKMISKRGYKEILANYLVAQTGAPAFLFSLPDIDGKMVALEDFKGKLIVVDFWFLSCAACAELEEYMRPVRKALEDRDDIIFISINVDLKKENWIKGLKSGQYTDMGNKNISTFGLGTRHQAFTYYGYSGCPQLLIIDRNLNIINSQTNRPNSRESSLSFLLYLQRLASKYD
ncbi:TlpA disulfide reductase family protein [Pedobacter sp. ASV28]|uniref:TlpA family protein disulfide reductase n=1 Tax=Pedobacter sp. ASV28 TaxID=2795123 RepID=UPI0018EE39E4|nr:TlpA disulfide reductase family protein [Pedobacter sp. ASV28]